jgi:hypothetical protein
MTDTELDELLDRWVAPVAPLSLRANVRAGLITPRPRRRRLAIWALAGVAAALLIAVQAFAQMLTTARIPYLVESEFFAYAEDGSASVQLRTTSYDRDGREVFLSKSFPAESLRTMAARVLDFGNTAFLRPIQELTLLLVASPEQIQKVKELARLADCRGGNCTSSWWIIGNRTALLKSGCEVAPIMGHETILGYPTAAIQREIGPNLRITAWLAPGLGCFALKSLIEEKQSDGTFEGIRGRRALKVTMNP